LNKGAPQVPAKTLHDFPTDSAGQIEALGKMRSEGERWRNNWGKDWDRNVAVVRGDLWPDTSTKPLFLANLISPTVKRKAGLLVEAKPGIEVRPRRSGLGISAQVLKQTIAALMDEHNVSMTWEIMALYLAGFGCGFWKIGYDPLANYEMGDVVMPDVDPRLMLVDPIVRRATNLWQAQYIGEESVVPYSWVQRMFPKIAHEVEPGVNVSYESNDTHKVSWFERMIDKIRKKAGATDVTDDAVPRVYLQTWWIADYSTDSNGDRIYPGGRRIFLTGDDKILNPSNNPKDLKYGQANPYWDGLWPYVMLDSYPDLDHPFGQDEVTQLRKINEPFNAVGHMTTRTMVKNIPWIILDQGSVDAQTVQDIKELEEVIIEKTPGRTVERNPPTQPTAANIQFMQYMQALMELSSGLNDGALQGKGRVEQRSGVQLEGLMQQAQILIRAQARRFENMIERGGQLLVSRIFQYFTTDRILTYIDNNQIKDYEFQKEQLRNEIVQLAQKAEDERALEETKENMAAGRALKNALVQSNLTEEKILTAVRGAWKLYRFKVLPFSTLASTKIARSQLLQQLAGSFAIPQSMVTKEAGFENAEELRIQAVKEFQEGLALGVPPPTPPKGSKK
jgi:hypothetical protein